MMMLVKTKEMKKQMSLKGMYEAVKSALEVCWYSMPLIRARRWGSMER